MRVQLVTLLPSEQADLLNENKNLKIALCELWILISMKRIVTSAAKDMLVESALALFALVNQFN